jgi:hypothetical protein
MADPTGPSNPKRRRHTRPRRRRSTPRPDRPSASRPDDEPSSGDGRQDGTAVLSWLDTPAATRTARRLAARYRLSGWDAEPENVVAEAQLRVWQRLRSDQPLKVYAPSAYGTAVMDSVLVAVIAERERSGVELPESLANQPEPDASAIDPSLAGLVDRVRTAVTEIDVGPRTWLVDAALTYIDLTVGDLHMTCSAPQPRAGARPAQARAWAALWHVGFRDLFPTTDGDPRVRRARYIRRLLGHIERASETALAA